MPEMPEVQAHAERMSFSLSGASLQKFELLNFASLKTFDPPPDSAVGSKLKSVGRRGKSLLIQFANQQTHVVHLMQGGRLRPDEKRSKKPRLGLARWIFDIDGTEQAWLLTEAGTERKAGVWVVPGDVNKVEPLAHLGPEPDQLNIEAFGKLLAENSRRLHGLLRQQSFVAGIGRMLANEICFEAKVSPFANASKLGDEAVGNLFESMQSVISAATDHERSLDDIGKSVDRPSKVHNRAGEACLNCDDTIRTVEYRRYTVYYCPTDQTGGKLLADNTTSKFLK